MKISEAQESVASFHRHVRVCEKAALDDPSIHRDYITQVVRELKCIADGLERCVEDPFGLRLHLELEELAEKFEAMMNGDEVAALDGAADQLYVQLGTAAIFGWPLEAAFEEVHRSNMTKEKQPSDPSAARVRQKGPNYQPPDIAGVLRDHRAVCHCGMLMRDHHQGSSCTTPRVMEYELTRNTEAPGVAYD